MKVSLTAALLIFILPVYSFAQQTQRLPIATFGNVQNHYTTKAQVLENPQLICSTTNCEITGFSFMILKHYDKGVTGPYYIYGARLTEEIINMLKAMPDLSTTIFIDSIQATYNNKKMQLPKMSFQFGN